MTLEDLKFDEHGLIPAVVQDAATLRVLTLAYMNAESLQRTLETKETWFWSRSRRQLWHKGETSGNTQRVLEVVADCDGDAVMALVNPSGPACHTGADSCFHNRLLCQPETQTKGKLSESDLGATLLELYDVVVSRNRERPEGSYTTYLLDQGLDKILKKIGEEAAETIIAAKNEQSGPLISEAADLLYHLIVLLAARGVTLTQLSQELIGRRSNNDE